MNWLAPTFHHLKVYMILNHNSSIYTIHPTPTGHRRVSDHRATKDLAQRVHLQEINSVCRKIFHDNLFQYVFVIPQR